MTAKERILAIRLLEELRKHPSHAAALGVEGRLRTAETTKKQG